MSNYFDRENRCKRILNNMVDLDEIGLIDTDNNLVMRTLHSGHRPLNGIKEFLGEKGYKHIPGNDSYINPKVWRKSNLRKYLETRVVMNLPPYVFVICTKKGVHCIDGLVVSSYYPELLNGYCKAMGIKDYTIRIRNPITYWDKNHLSVLGFPIREEDLNKYKRGCNPTSVSFLFLDLNDEEMNKLSSEVNDYEHGYMISKEYPNEPIIDANGNSLNAEYLEPIVRLAGTLYKLNDAITGNPKCMASHWASNRYPFETTLYGMVIEKAVWLTKSRYELQDNVVDYFKQEFDSINKILSFYCLDKAKKPSDLMIAHYYFLNKEKYGDVPMSYVDGGHFVYGNIVKHTENGRFFNRQLTSVELEKGLFDVEKHDIDPNGFTIPFKLEPEKGVSCGIIVDCYKVDDEVPVLRTRPVWAKVIAEHVDEKWRFGILDNRYIVDGNGTFTETPLGRYLNYPLVETKAITSTWDEMEALREKGLLKGPYIDACDNFYFLVKLDATYYGMTAK